MPKIKAMGDRGIIAIGCKLRDDELLAHGEEAGNGEEAVHIPAEVIEAYVAEILKNIGQAMAEPLEHEAQQVAQIGGAGEKTRA